MVDFYIRLHAKGNDPYTGIDYFSRKHLTKFTYENERVQIYGYYNINGNTPLVTQNEILFVTGDIHPRIEVKADITYSGILRELSSGITALQKYKGNFVICRINHTNGDITIVNSQLGIRHLYYSCTGEKIYAGNNLNLFRNDFSAVNNSAVLQQLLFNYTITDETLLKGVHRLLPGEYASTDGDGFFIKRYFDIQKLILSEGSLYFDTEEFVYLFNKSVQARARSGINVSFSGGIEDRTIVSSLINQAIKFKSYSFGPRDGHFNDIPFKISKEQKFDYEPIYIEDDFYASYSNTANELIYFSDGTPFNDGVYQIYAYKKYFDNYLSMLDVHPGNEIMVPVFLRTECMNELYYQTVYLGRKVIIPEYLRNRNYFKFLNCDFAAEIPYVSEAVNEKNRDLKEFRIFEKGHMYYLYDLINTGFRMHHGTAFHLERAYCERMTPYYDLDVIEYLFSTDYSEIFRNSFAGGKSFDRKYRKIYAAIMKMNYPDLNTYPVDSGYTPSDLLSPLKSLLIHYRVRKHRNSIAVCADSRKRETAFLKYFCLRGAANQNIFDNKKLIRECGMQSEVISGSANLSNIILLAAWLDNGQ